jgi:hypothetical protein
MTNIYVREVKLLWNLYCSFKNTLIQYDSRYILLLSLKLLIILLIDRFLILEITKKNCTLAMKINENNT